MQNFTHTGPEVIHALYQITKDVVDIFEYAGLHYFAIAGTLLGAILNTYFGSEDWMEVCQLPYRNHRNGDELTGFPDDKFEVETVLDYLASQQVPALSERASK